MLRLTQRHRQLSSAPKARELLGWQDGTYNGLLSVKPLELGDEISKTVTCEDIKEQMQTILTEMSSIIYSLAVIGAIICIASLYVSVNMLISENRHNISMLKVLGLKNREINRMIIDVNHIIIPFGIAVGMIAGYLMMVVVFRIYSAIEGVLYYSCHKCEEHIAHSCNCCGMLCYFTCYCQKKS